MTLARLFALVALAAPGAAAEPPAALIEATEEASAICLGLGGTPLEELYILFRRVSQLLEARGVTAKHVWVGEFATSMEMAGASISILHLDEELDRLVAAPANTPFFQHVAG